MSEKPNNHSGFTIVELLIVIVVIAILAAISIVAYNGIQQRANNGKTTQALTAWVKAMKLYKVDNGRWPGGAVCLGQGYKYGPEGTATTGQAQCRQDNATNGFLENSTFNNNMKDYVGSSFPTPAFITTKNSDTMWRRGLSYYFGGGAGNIVYVDAALAGDVDCLAAAGVVSTSRAVWAGNTYCYYQLGLTTDT